MTDLRKAAEMALEALDDIHSGNLTPMAEESWNKAKEALRQALAQPVDAVNISAECVDKTVKRKHKWVGLTEWFGLTDDERKQIVSYIRDPIDWVPAVEAKLKEKNT